MEKWTQDEAIAFECAREVITDMMAMRSARVAEEEEKQTPSVEALAALEKELFDLACEGAALRVSSHDNIARIRNAMYTVRRSGLFVRSDRRDINMQFTD